MIIGKNIFKIAGLSLLLGVTGCAESKKIPAASTVIENGTYCELKKFTGRYYEGKIYINWLVNTNISNYYFVLEKSVRGEEFKVIHIVKGFPSPMKDGLLYSYTDKNLTVDSRIYRLRAVQPIKNDRGLMLYTSSKNLFKNLENTVITVLNDNKVASK